MKTKTMLIAAQLLCGVAFATEFNLADDFSISNNPSATWTYGWFHNAIPGGSSLETMAWNGSAWSGSAGVSIWKNETTSSIGNVAPGQVAFDTNTNTPVVVRWTAPAEMGLATIQIDGEFAPGVSGIEIRRGSGVFHSFTNASAFSVELMVEPGDEIDFVAIGGGTIPLDLTITTLKEHLDLTNFDDFDRYSPGSDWTAIPGWTGFRQIGDGTNSYVAADDNYGWGKGEYRDLFFPITTNTSHISIRSFAKLGPKYSADSYGRTGIRLCGDSITTGNTQVVEYWMRAYGVESDLATISFKNEEGVSVTSTDAPAIDTWVEFRADMDLSYESDDGKFGLFSLFQRLSSSSSWRPVDGLFQLEMKIVDPTVITKLCVIVGHDANNGGFLPQVDDIRICSGENYNLGSDTNLLTGTHFSGTSKDWRNDGYGAQSRISSGNEATAGPFHDGTYLYQNDAYTSQVYQVMNLLNQGFTPEDIDAGMYRAAFGGWQYGGSGSVGQIEIECLDINNQPISTNSLPEITNQPAWTEHMATNPIPAQTRSIRYSAYLSSGARLDDAHLSVLGIPQEDKALTVAFIHGSPIPAAGTTSNSWGTVIHCSVADVVSSTTQYECVGWTGTGSVPSSGTSNSVDVTLTEDSSITWNWVTNYWLDVNVVGSGSVDVVDGFYVADSEQILTATPAAGWLFMGWSGDTSGTNSETFVFMTEPQAVTATFSDDADGDGLTNTEEDAAGSNPWKTDTDGDGFDDKLEVDHNWNPAVSDQWAVDYIADNGDAFGLYPSNTVLDVAVGQMILQTFGSNAVLQLQLEESDDLVTWTNAGDAVEWSWPVDGDKKFFRVRSY